MRWETRAKEPSVSSADPDVHCTAARATTILTQIPAPGPAGAAHFHLLTTDAI